MESTLFTKDCTIAISTSLSPSFSLNGAFAIVGIIMPAAWDAADLTFQISMDPLVGTPADATPTNFYNVYDDSGGEVTVTASTSRAMMLSQNVLIAGNHYKIRSGTAGSAVAQTAARTLTVIYRRVG